MLPDFERADLIGEFWSYSESRTFAELLIDFEEDRTLRAVLLGILREATGEGSVSPFRSRGATHRGEHRRSRKSPGVPEK